MIWLEFVASALIIVVAATRLAAYGDVIALRTRLGGMFVGTLLLAGATSLPELLTAINAIEQNVPNLTVGNIFGSSMFNIFLLAMLDLVYWRSRFVRRLDINHALTASAAVALNGLSVFFILAQIDWQIAWIGVDSLTLILTYIILTRLMFGGGSKRDAAAPEPPDVADDVPGLVPAGIGFGAATLVLVFITPILVSSSVEIAKETGLSAGFVGIALVGIITSLPEVVTTVSAARLGAYDLAAGNLFGSNIFNIFALGLTDVFFTDGRFLAAVSSDMTLAGILAVLLSHVALFGNLLRNIAPRESRSLVIELDSLLIVFAYIAGMLLLYNRGLIG